MGRCLQIMNSLKKSSVSLTSSKTTHELVTVSGYVHKEGGARVPPRNMFFERGGERFESLVREIFEAVGVVDLGGGSVQMAYAISESDAATAPKVSDGEDPYVKEMFLRGRKYYLYVHSYLHYGLLAARAEILKVSDDAENPCVLSGYDGSYEYGGKVFKASSFSSGSSLNECKSVAHKALKVNESSCTHMKCTFGGIWNGGGGDGQRNLFVASFFFDRAAGFADPNAPVAIVRPADFEDAAKQACQTKLENAKSTFPHVEEVFHIFAWIWYTSIHCIYAWQEITLVKKVKYDDALLRQHGPWAVLLKLYHLRNGHQCHHSDYSSEFCDCHS